MIDLGYILSYILVMVSLTIIFSIARVVNIKLERKLPKQDNNLIIVKHKPVLKWFGLVIFIIFSVAYISLVYMNEIPKNIISLIVYMAMLLMCGYLVLIGINSKVVIFDGILYHTNLFGRKREFKLQQLCCKKVYDINKIFYVRIKFFYIKKENG